MGTLSKLLNIGCIFFMATNVCAESTNKIEFSADAVVSIPQQPVRQTKLFVSGKAVRSESIINGQNITEIVYPDEGRAILINHPIKSYKERTFNLQANKINDATPCTNIVNSKCEKLGSETIDGMKTEKWQIISNNQGRKMRTLHWIDTKRKLAIREFFPDGSVTELKKVKNEKVNGRLTEKWKRTLSRPDGTSSQSYQWYDKKLGIAIKEELPGGYIRELKNIKIARQPKEKFSVPEGYAKVAEQSENIPYEYINR